MRISSPALWMIASTAAIARAERCAAPPVNLPLRSLAITPGAVSHGVPVYVGTPRQTIALTPSLQLDNAFLPRWTASCVYNGSEAAANDSRWMGRDAREVCAELYGGGFNSDLSSSFHDNGTNDQVSEDWLRSVGFTDWRFVTEAFAFADYVEAYVEWNGVLPEKRNGTATFILPDDGATFGGMDMSALSLAPDSTLLKALHEQETVPSRSWSLTNRSLCLGCIDSNAYSGSFHTFKPADRNEPGGLPCVFQATVEALTYYLDANAQGTSLIDKKSFIACIDPGVTSLVLPSSAYHHLPDRLTPSAEASGNDTSVLMVKLQGGLTVNITASVTATDSNSTTTTTTAPLLTSGQHGAYGPLTPVLGKPFTDALLLRWDSSTSEYSMASLSARPSPLNLQPLGCSPFPDAHTSHTASASAGAIAGSLVGGFSAGLLFAGACAFFFVRGRRGPATAYERMRADDAMSLRTASSARTQATDPFVSPALSWREGVWARWATPKVQEGEGMGVGLGIGLGLGAGRRAEGPHLVEDRQVFEAPEGGTAWPAKRVRAEMFGGGGRYTSR